MSTFKNAVTKECPRCKKEYRYYSDRQIRLYREGCVLCAKEKAKIVYQCDTCEAVHFHQFQNCSKCPGKTAQVLIWGTDYMNAWNKASNMDNLGEW